MLIIIDKLFGCETGNLSPSGRNIIHIISMDELNQRFQK
jgi:hypothetical protein